MLACPPAFWYALKGSAIDWDSMANAITKDMAITKLIFFMETCIYLKAL